MSFYAYEIKVYMRVETIILKNEKNEIAAQLSHKIIKKKKNVVNNSR